MVSEATDEIGVVMETVAVLELEAVVVSELELVIMLVDELNPELAVDEGDDWEEYGVE